MAPSLKTPQSPKTSKRVSAYTIIGILLTLINFLIYSLLARTIFGNTNDYLWLDSMISYVMAAFVAYFLHSKITWRERAPGRSAIIKFFAWNFFTALAISPFFTWLFGYFTPIYQFAHSISSALHLPFDYEFVESTGIFGFTTVVTMLLNYLFYDKIVFGTKDPDTSSNLKVTKDSPASSPLVSIIVPIYNTAKYLPACLKSITNQKYQNLQIILVDDGSSDNSGEIADEFAGKDSRIQVIHQKNGGQSAARNMGLRAATGNYISFIDSDDEIQSSFITDLLAAYNSSNISLSVCGVRYNRLYQKATQDVYLGKSGAKLPCDSRKAYSVYLLARDGRLYSCNNKLYEARFAKKCRFDQHLNFGEDTKFVLDYLARTTGNIAFVPKPLYIYNFGTDSSTIKTTGTIWRNWQNAYQNLKTWLGPHPSIIALFWLNLVHLRWRISYLRSCRRAKAMTKN